jgi:hypothetical protein
MKPNHNLDNSSKEAVFESLEEKRDYFAQNVEKYKHAIEEQLTSISDEAKDKARTGLIIGGAAIGGYLLLKALFGGSKKKKSKKGKKEKYKNLTGYYDERGYEKRHGWDEDNSSYMQREARKDSYNDRYLAGKSARERHYEADSRTLDVADRRAYGQPVNPYDSNQFKSSAGQTMASEKKKPGLVNTNQEHRMAATAQESHVVNFIKSTVGAIVLAIAKEKIANFIDQYSQNKSNGEKSASATSRPTEPRM